ncbi:hypothetical protein [Winogradskyella sp. Asnod2-B02-A]|uniref:hypothetical protein n=1 Tax=Winogradskyella sp. Asnod2-B02-A TaxID=3160583 RepID=UPI00386B20AA
MIEQNNTTKDLKFYSQKSIGLATFIGGPLAAGYLIKENYKALNQGEKGRTALIISIIATLIVFGSLYMIPESIMSKIPNMIIPAIYTGIIYLIVDKIHGTILNNHDLNNYPFYSGWRAAGIGVISLIILVAIIFATIFLIPDEVYDTYDAEMEQFTKNEEASLAFYDHINTEENETLLNEIDNIAIPKWKENIEIIKRTNSIEGLPLELVNQNKKLLKYSELRLEAFTLFKNLIIHETDNYNTELNRVHNEIDVVIESLN